MKQVKKVLSALALTGMLVPTFALAQQEKKENKEVEQIIITRKGSKDQKVNIEINGDKVTVNGKPADQLKENEVSVKVRKFKEMEALSGMNRFNDEDHWNFNEGNNVFMYNVDENRAMLGVATENSDKGAAVKEVSKESAAEKAGLKAGDIITKVDDTKIVTPDDLTKAIQAHKPGDKVTIAFLRDQKEQQTTADLTKWKGMPMQMGMGNLNLNIPQFNFKSFQDKNDLNGKLWNVVSDRPKLGMSVQDTEDGKGVKVIDVDDEGNAKKAGIKEGDLITSINGKEVNSADEVARIVRENRDKNTVSIKLKRNGKTQDIEVKIPRKLKTADL